MKDVKLFAINTKDANLVKTLSTHAQNKTAVELDSSFLEKKYEGFSRNGLASTELSGNLVSDPQPMINPLSKKAKEIAKNRDQGKEPDVFNDRAYVYEAQFCYETDVYWDNNNIRHAKNNYITMFFESKGAKCAISRYFKGDGMIVHGYLRSLPKQSPEEKRLGVNVQFLVVTDFKASPGTHLRREIREKFGQVSAKNNGKTYRSMQDVLNDKSLTEAEQKNLIFELAQQGQATSKPKSSNNNQTQESKNESNPEPSQTCSDDNNYSSNDDSENFNSLTNEEQNYGQDITSDDLRKAFEDDF